MAQQGARVAVSDVNEGAGQETLRQIRASGGEAIFVAADVSRKEDVDRLIAETLNAFGRLDCAFNNAGIEGSSAPTSDCADDNWHRTLAVNLTGLWYCLRAELLVMQRQGSGAIVNMASIAGLVGFDGLPAYVASKHGVVGLTKTAALECAKTGIRVNAVCPGVIDTPMVGRLTDKDDAAKEALADGAPVDRLGRPEEVAAAVVWLCSDAASFVTGIAMPVDGGCVARLY
jgi:NAD(P)-dependent dehydrogenase (short-subunit alcohol dehydrogenase family)